MNTKKAEKLANALDLKFSNIGLLQTALVHRSYPNEHPKEGLSSNERLEFLGDAILEFLTTEFLYQRFPNEQEGVLTSYRAALVKTENLAEVAKGLNLGEYILMSKGETSAGNTNNTSILADLFEAVLGAIYIDQGLGECKNLLEKCVWNRIDGIVEEDLHIDAKTKLQTQSQLHLKITPVYEIIDEKGKDHEKVFEAAVKFQNKVVGSGKGRSKQHAEQEAAKNALENLKF